MGRWWVSKIVLKAEGQRRTQDRLWDSRVERTHPLLGSKAQRREGHVVSLSRGLLWEFSVPQELGQPRSKRLFLIYPKAPGVAGTEGFSGWDKIGLSIYLIIQTEG